MKLKDFLCFLIIFEERVGYFSKNYKPLCSNLPNILFYHREYKFFSKNLQKEVNTKMYLSPDGTILQGERRMKQYLSKNNLNSTLTDTEQFTLLTSKPVKSKTLQSEMEERVWKNCDYHSLDNWKFRLSTEGQRFEYKSPDGEVFYSRGSVLRVLIKKGRTSYSELMMLKKLLKNNDNKINLKENDRFIRTLPVNQNFFIFIKTRYCFLTFY